MSLVKRNDVFLPTLLDEIFKPDWFGGIHNLDAKLPPVNILESEKYFEIELAIPGYKKEDFVLDIDKDILTVSTKKEEENKPVKKNFIRSEFQKYPFERKFNLSKVVDQDRVEASYENGVLKFNLPKKKEALPKAKREINLS